MGRRKAWAVFSAVMPGLDPGIHMAAPLVDRAKIVVVAEMHRGLPGQTRQ
jgi:hypothetical protein